MDVAHAALDGSVNKPGGVRRDRVEELVHRERLGEPTIHRMMTQAVGLVRDTQPFCETRFFRAENSNVFSESSPIGGRPLKRLERRRIYRTISGKIEAPVHRQIG